MTDDERAAWRFHEILIVPVFLALVLLATACTSVVAIDPPRRGPGKTLLVVRAVDAKVIAVDVVDASVAAPSLPSFGRRGDVDIALIELRCPPQTLSLQPGPLALVDQPFGQSRLPPPLSVWTTTVRGDAADAWTTPAEPLAWVDDALRRIDVAEDVRCRVRGFAFTAENLAAPNGSGVVALSDGSALLLSPAGFQRIEAPGMLTSLGVRVTGAHSSTTSLAGAQDPDGTLWVVDQNGRLARGTLAGGDMTYVTSTVTYDIASLARDERGGLYAGVVTYGETRDEERRTPIELYHYDRGRDAWSRLLQNLHPRGFGLISLLPLEHSVLVAGATVIIDRAGRVRGSGHLLEIDPTTSTTVAIEITPAGSAKHQAAVSIADTRMLGRTVSTFECVESQDGSGCSELASQSDPHSRLVHLVDGEWQLVPRFDLPMFVVNIADAGPDAIWVTGFDSRTFKSSLMVFLADGQLCTLGENGSNNARITPLGEGAWIASDPSHPESTENFVTVYTAIPRPSECD